MGFIISLATKIEISAYICNEIHYCSIAKIQRSGFSAKGVSKEPGLDWEAIT